MMESRNDTIHNIPKIYWIWSYSGLSLSRTRKGPTILFEVEKVRDKENYRKNQNFY